MKRKDYEWVSHSHARPDGIILNVLGNRPEPGAGLVLIPSAAPAVNKWKGERGVRTLRNSARCIQTAAALYRLGTFKATRLRSELLGTAQEYLVRAVGCDRPTWWFAWVSKVYSSFEDGHSHLENRSIVRHDPQASSYCLRTSTRSHVSDWMERLTRSLRPTATKSC